MSLLVPYLLFGICLFLSSSVMLAVVLWNKTIRKKYNVFSVKFGVDVLTSACLIVVGSLNRSAEGQCDAGQILSASIPLVQALLLVSEVADWWLAASFPVYFHNSSLVCRLLPFFLGVILCVIVITAVVTFDIAYVAASCISSPGSPFIMGTYGLSLAVITFCLLALVLLLTKHRRTIYYGPIMFHFVATLLLQEFPLLSVIILRYTDADQTLLSADIANFCVAVHSLVHTAFFVYGHEDYRQGIIALLPKNIRGS